VDRDAVDGDVDMRVPKGMIETEKEIGSFVKVEGQLVGTKPDTDCIEIIAGSSGHLSDIITMEKEGSVVCRNKEFERISVCTPNMFMIYALEKWV
jgi:hypothetical protein